jgi:REP element-mobilizing transposase RayT
VMEPFLIRKRMARTSAFGEVRFLTFSCERRLRLLSNPRVAHLFAGRLALAREHFRMKLIAWVVMPEHVAGRTTDVILRGERTLFFGFGL